MTSVMTVTGPVAARDLGFTLVHEHIFLDLTRDVLGRNSLLNDPELAYRELLLYKQAGGVTVVDQTTGGLRGHDHDITPTKHALAIREMARRVGLQIVLGAGWYREPYYDAASLAGQDRPDRRGARARRDPGDRRHRRPGGPPGRDRLSLHVDLARRGARVPGRGAGSPAHGRHDRHARAQLARRARPAGHPAGGGRGPAAGHRRPRALVPGPRVPRRAREARRVPLVRPDGIPAALRARADARGHRAPRGAPAWSATSSCRRTCAGERTTWPTAGAATPSCRPGCARSSAGSGSATRPTTG